MITVTQGQLKDLEKRLESKIDKVINFLSNSGAEIPSPAKEAKLVA